MQGRDAISNLEEALVEEPAPVAPAPEPPAKPAAVAAPAPAAEEKKQEKQEKQEKKQEKAVVSEPPLNFDRLKSVGTFVRTLEIWSFVFAFVFRRVALELKFTYKGSFTEAKKLERTEKLANWLRLGLLRLGPTFIKIGQQFSTRVDVLSKPFIRELEKLQDRVPPFPTSLAKQIIAEELGKPVEDVYEDFQEEALAAASLGQVHLAKLKSTGEQAIVKVQAPGSRRSSDIDLQKPARLQQWLQKVDPKTRTAPRATGSPSSTRRRASSTTRWITRTRRTTQRVCQAVEREWIKVPVYSQYTKQRLMCMEYSPSRSRSTIRRRSRRLA